MSAAAALRRLQGKIALVTGGSGGIGEATVRLFANHGAKVVIADTRDDVGKKVAESLSPWASYIHCDVTKERDVSAAVDFAIEKHGQLDVIYNNAGITDPQKWNLPEYEMENYERVMNINAKGVMHGMKHAARVMIPNKKGCIINAASIAGILGGTATYAYIASKHAVVGLTKNGAAELGEYGIRVNCVSAGVVATDMAIQFLKRDATADVKAELEAAVRAIGNLKGITLDREDIANAVLYLASEESKYVSGHNLVVDGGTTVVNKDPQEYRKVFGK